MSAFVLHDQAGEAKSIATGSAPSPLPSGLTARTITDAEFTGLTSGTHRWNATTKAVEVDTAKAAVEANQSTLRQQAIDALTANRGFVAIASPTNAQNAAQVKALTRQMNGVIRQLLGLLDGTD